MFIVPVIIKRLFLFLTVVLSDGFTDYPKRLLIRGTNILHLNNLVGVNLELFLQLIDDSLVDFILLTLSDDLPSQHLVDLVFSVGLSQLLAQSRALIAGRVSLTKYIVYSEL